MSEKPTIITSESDKTVLVSRSGGKITPMRISQESFDERGRPYGYVPPRHGYTGDIEAKPIGRLTLTEEYQQHLAEELAADLIDDETKDRPRLDEQERSLPAKSTASKVGGAVLGIVDVAVSPAGGSAGPERREVQPNERLERLFQPIVRPEVLEIRSDYSYMLEVDDEAYRRGYAEEQKRKQPVDEAKAAQAEYDRFVNPQTRQLSAEYLGRVRHSDPEINRLIIQYAGEVSDGMAVDALREQADLRYAVGLYLLDKLNKIAITTPNELPDRVLMNGQKRTDAKQMPVDYMTSREYVAYLALAKIDGSFNGERQSSNDGVDYDPRTGKVAQSQHRYAADLVLNT